MKWGVGALVVQLGLMTACGSDTNSGAPSNLSEMVRLGIVGGMPVNPSSDAAAQHVVGLYIEFGTRPSLCTGTLIAGDLVLTAAHCVDNQPTRITIVFGADMRAGGSRVTRPSSNVVIHPKWVTNQNNQWDEGDVAVVQFTGDLPAGFSPARLLHDASVLQVGASIREMGYGVARADGPKAQRADGVLREADVKITDVSSSPTEIVSDESAGQGVCFGDSGGPAFVSVKGIFLLWGVASTVSSELCNQTAIHTSVLSYLDWLSATALQLGSHLAA